MQLAIMQMQTMQEVAWWEDYCQWYIELVGIDQACLGFSTILQN